MTDPYVFNKKLYPTIGDAERARERYEVAEFDANWQHRNAFKRWWFRIAALVAYDIRREFCDRAIRFLASDWKLEANP